MSAEDVIQKFRERQAEQQQAPAQTEPPVESQAFRTALQGATYNFADEIEAGVRSLLPDSLGGGEYEQIRDSLRSKLKAYKKRNPGAAITNELMGALVPAVASMAIPFAREANMLRLSGIAGAEGLTAYAGAMEGAPSAKDIIPAAMSGGVSAVGGPLLQSATGATGSLFTRLANFARETLGNKPATAVQAEIRRLAEGTGKTPDEIVQDVMDGKIMAENRTLQAAVRALRSKGGEAGAIITEALPARRSATRAQAMEGVQEGLTPQTQGNVVAAVRADDDALRKMEREDYKRVFGDVPAVTPEIADTMLDVLARFPDTKEQLGKLYSERNLVPLFDVAENKALQFKRAPTLEDAEILRRAIDEQASTMYRSGAGTRGEAAAEAALGLRGQIDEAYPDLQAVRAQARERRSARDMFEEGRRALAKNADEVELMFQDAGRQGDASVRAFRAGVMDAIRNRGRRSPSLMGRLADPDRQEGAVLRAVFPEDSADDIQRKLEIAAGSEELYNKVLFNSMTAPEQAAASQMGMATTAADIARVTQGDPLAAVTLVARKIASAMPQLSDRERADIARVLVTEDPNLVMRALTDKTNTDELLRRAAQVANTAGSGVRVAFGQQAGARVAEENR